MSEEINFERSFGRRNPHCSNCGDERGGPFGHEISECLYRSGMTAEELARTMPPDKARTYWSVIVDRYLDAKLAALDSVQRSDERCICGTPGTGNFDGPQRDCPVHGERSDEGQEKS